MRMMMNSVQQHRQSWRLNIQAKAKNFDFKLSATSLFRHCNCSFFRLSLKLKLFRLFLITLKSEPQISTPANPRPSTSRLRRFLQKLRIRRRPNNLPTSPAQRGLISERSVKGLGGIVGLLSSSFFKKDKDRVSVAGSITLFCVSSLTWIFKNLLRRNLLVFLVLLIAAVVGFSGIVDFWNHFKVITEPFWRVKKTVFNKFLRNVFHTLW